MRLILQKAKILLKQLGFGGIYSKGQFKAYEDAVQSLGLSGYENDSFAASLKEKTKLLLRDIRKTRTYQNDDLLLAHAVSLAANDGQVTVMDVGGGFGVHFIKTTQLITSKIKSWSVVETQAMVDHSGEFADEKLNFFSSMTDVEQSLETPDIAVFASSVHYLPDPLQSLKKTSEMKPEFIYIARTPMKQEGTGYVALQRSPSAFSFRSKQKDKSKTRVVRYPVNILTVRDVMGVLEPTYEVFFESTNPKSRFYVNQESLSVFNILFKRKH